jgi:hypothetical protein
MYSLDVSRFISMYHVQTMTACFEFISSEQELENFYCFIVKVKHVINYILYSTIAGKKYFSLSCAFRPSEMLSYTLKRL